MNDTRMDGDRADRVLAKGADVAADIGPGTGQGDQR
jgi:hypothetical protein